MGGRLSGGHAGGAWGNDTSASYSFTPPVSSDLWLKRDVALVGLSITDLDLPLSISVE